MHYRICPWESRSFSNTFQGLYRKYRKWAAKTELDSRNKKVKMKEVTNWVSGFDFIGHTVQLLKFFLPFLLVRQLIFICKRESDDLSERRTFSFISSSV